MLTRSQSKKLIDINNLPKEALFDLLLQVEPREIKIVCYSKNPRVRQICNSGLFKKAYKEKYPKKLIGDQSFANFGKGFIEIVDEKKLNVIRISYDEDSKELNYIDFIPHRQVYPSTMIPEELGYVNLDRYLLEKSPMTISIYENEDGSKYIMDVGRNNGYSFTVKQDEQFRKNYNQEVKEFLESIEREKWWNPNIQFGFMENLATEKSMKEFYEEVINIMKDMNLLEEYYPKID